MTPSTAKSAKPKAASADSAPKPRPSAALRYVARQPILDRQNRVHGYELLFRSGTKSFLDENSELATRTVMDDAVIYGMQPLTGGLPAFIKCTADALTDRLVDVLPAGMTVLELVEPGAVSKDLITICQLLKTQGFRLALGSYAWEPDYRPLVEVADYIKVDFTLLCASGRRYLRSCAARAAAAMVAEGVETQEDYRQACAEGFTFFQGYYFCRPTLLKNRKLPVNRLTHIRILQALHADPINMHALGEMVKQDISLTYRLLRLVNSPVCAMRQEVRSIETALMVVGEEMFRHMATLAIASELNADNPVEILRMAFVRGRFCEVGAGSAGLEPTEQYLLGLLSLLPAMLCVPIEEILPVLPLRASICTALGSAGKNRDRMLLEWIELHEQGDFKGCDDLARLHRLDRDKLAADYAAAVEWAESALHSVM